MFLGHQGPRRRHISDPGPGISWTRTICKAPSASVVSSMSCNLGRDLPGSEQLCARKRFGLSLVLRSRRPDYRGLSGPSVPGSVPENGECPRKRGCPTECPTGCSRGSGAQARGTLRQTPPFSGKLLGTLPGTEGPERPL